MIKSILKVASEGKPNIL